MTKAQLLTQLANTPGIARVLAEQVIEQAGGIRWYEVPVLEVDENDTLAWKKTIHFYVVDEGQAGEAAYFYKAEPKRDLPVTDAIFDAIKAYVFSQVNVINFNLLSYKEEVNGLDTNRMAIAEVYKLIDGTSASKQTWIVFNKNTGAISHREIA